MNGTALRERLREVVATYNGGLQKNASLLHGALHHAGIAALGASIGPGKKKRADMVKLAPPGAPRSPQVPRIKQSGVGVLLLDGLIKRKRREREQEKMRGRPQVRAKHAQAKKKTRSTWDKTKAYLPLAGVGAGVGLGKGLAEETLRDKFTKRLGKRGAWGAARSITGAGSTLVIGVTMADMLKRLKENTH